MLRILRPQRFLGSSLSPISKLRYMTTSEYHERADYTLDAITEGYEALIEKKPELDVDLSQGVLTLCVPPNGTYVINKQPPNQQIWLSSPLSGPKRYDWDEGARKWVYGRDHSSLGELLRRETLEATNLVLHLEDVD